MKKKTSITLRQRELPSGRIRLYLDVISNGLRHNETLGLFLEPERTRADRQRNRETMRLAEEICAKRILDARNDRFGLDGERPTVLFCEYFRSLISSPSRTVCTKRNWMTCLHQIKLYDKRAESLTFDDITSSWANGFVKHLLSTTSLRTGRPLNPSTVYHLISIFTTSLNTAARDHIISKDDIPTIRELPKVNPKERAFLTIDELRLLIASPCHPRYESIKDAFVFSCLTGLRWVDIRNLKWSNISTQFGFTRITFEQQKTRQQEYLDINEQAVEIINRQPKTSEMVFALTSSMHANNALRKRIMPITGIDKHITFHCARHTFAVMMLDIGTDIYTVSKLLGHTNIRTTQIYAKVLDRNKQAAVARISEILKQEKL